MNLYYKKKNLLADNKKRKVNFLKKALNKKNVFEPLFKVTAKEPFLFLVFSKTDKPILREIN